MKVAVSLLIAFLLGIITLTCAFSGAAVKNLKRLFPTDQSMVVVIDDRWEVWSHGPNLVKVVPCMFFCALRGWGTLSLTYMS